MLRENLVTHGIRKYRDMWDSEILSPMGILWTMGTTILNATVSGLEWVVTLSVRMSE